MNDPLSHVGPNGEVYDLAGDLVRPDAMVTSEGRASCIGCPWRATYGGCLSPYNLKKKQ